MTIEHKVYDGEGNGLFAKRTYGDSDMAQLKADAYHQLEEDGTLRVVATVTNGDGDTRIAGIAVNNKDGNLLVKGTGSYRAGTQTRTGGWRYIQRDELDGREGNEKWLGQHLAKLQRRAQSLNG